MFTLSDQDIQDYLSGISTIDLAKLRNVSSTTIQRALTRQGISLRSHAESIRKSKKIGRPKFTVPQEGIDRYLQGVSSVTLGKEYGVTAATIRTSLKKQGIKVRTYEEAHKAGLLSKCQSAYHQGVSVEDWKGYKVNDTQRQLRSVEWKQWRTAVYERDNYTCRICGDSRGGNLEPHHIYQRAKYPERIFDVDNGITLCTPCHWAIRRKEDEMISTLLSLLPTISTPTY
jgi:hypothetical protein